MRARALFFLLMLGCGAATPSVVSSPPTPKPRVVTCEERTPYLGHHGSAEVLRGRVLTVSIFVADAYESWSPEDKREMVQKTKMAQNFIRREARDWGVDVTFENLELGLVRDVRYALPPTHHITGGRIWVRELLKSMAVTDLEDWVDGLRKRHDVEQVHLAVFPKATGRSYALDYNAAVAKWREDEDKYDDELESTIIYARNILGQVEDATTIAHEILHLYGARDLYESSRFARDRHLVARSQYKDDVMLTNGYIWALKIQDYTAWLLGWSSCKRSWFDMLTYDLPTGYPLLEPSEARPGETPKNHVPLPAP